MGPNGPSEIEGNYGVVDVRREYWKLIGCESQRGGAYLRNRKTNLPPTLSDWDDNWSKGVRIRN
jgi:hypothetical protein